VQQGGWFANAGRDDDHVAVPHMLERIFRTAAFCAIHFVHSQRGMSPIAFILLLRRPQHGSSARRGHATRAPSAGRAADNERQEDQQEMA